MASKATEREGMNYQVGDTVRVVRRHSLSASWLFRHFEIPGPGFPYARAKGSGTIVEVIQPYQHGGVSNAGGYRVRLDDGTVHYYSEAELRPAPDRKR